MITEPSTFSAAKARAAEYTALTLEVRLPATAAEFPPVEAPPQVITEPLPVMAAKALRFGNSPPEPNVQMVPLAVLKLPP